MLDLPLKRGINIHTDRYSLKGELVDEKYFKIIKEAGFDHVRLPIDGAFLQDEGEPLWAHVKKVCERALKNSLVPIIDMHGFPEICVDPKMAKPKYLEMWKKLSSYWADLDQRVAFELLNEPNYNYNFQYLNEIQNEAISVVRKENPTRLIAAATTHFNVIENLHFLDLPEDPNVYVAIHDYTPMCFTHQGAEWMDGYAKKGIKWGSEAEREYLTARYDVAASWAKLHNRFLHLGEFGVLYTADMDERAKWTSFITKLCEERGIGWSYWEFCNGFGAYDMENGCWRPKLLKALIPETEI